MHICVDRQRIVVYNNAAFAADNYLLTGERHALHMDVARCLSVYVRQCKGYR